MEFVVRIEGYERGRARGGGGNSLSKIMRMALRTTELFKLSNNNIR